MKRVGLVLKRDKPEARALALDLVPRLLARGCEALLDEEHRGLVEGATYLPMADFAGKIDLLVVLGGDGTLMLGASLVSDKRIPILGINLGRLGFLTPFDPSNAREALDRAIEGTLAIEERLRLLVKVHVAGGGVIERFASNDVVISQGAMARLIELDATLDGKQITVYRADGLIICTPTGSTAYNLAAGGPIVAPGQAAMAVTPICPHTLTNRPLVVPASSALGITIVGESQSVMVTVDGQWVHPFRPGDRVEVSGAKRPFRIYRSDKSYFEILREKLRWG